VRNLIIKGARIIEARKPPNIAIVDFLRLPLSINVNGMMATPGGLAAITTNP